MARRSRGVAGAVSIDGYIPPFPLLRKAVSTAALALALGFLASQFLPLKLTTRGWLTMGAAILVAFVIHAGVAAVIGNGRM